MNKMTYWKINGDTEVQGFALTKYDKDSDKRLLRAINSEWGYPDDKVSLDIVPAIPEIALIWAVDGRGTTDGSPPFKKFICYSFAEEKQLMTTYQAYLYNGPVVVEAWDEKKKRLLENVDMEHIDITPDRVPAKVVRKHFERIAGKQCVVEGLRDKAEKAFFDMLWNVRSY
ncbi:hypothetical protein GOV13_00625 [Candidatus Pacearchaeota archaeon]|nr:hypothetical protein [Candidatus Pacearchaeota archaeon]